MLKKLSTISVVLAAGLMTSCANSKTPASLQDQPKPMWMADAVQFESVRTDEHSEAYDVYGELYENDPVVADKEKEPIIGAEVEDTIATQKLSEVALPDVPLVLNQQVEKWMDYFQGRGRKYFTRWLARSSRYVPMMKQILRENGLPEGLIYLSMIESGFSPNAYSRAKAVGPWQFMKFTGERYGLRVNYWIDERMDAEKSTLAAAQHLKDLYDEFDHWYLAAAGYNAGAGKISRAIKRYDTDDFWEMSKYRYLKPETKNYVPKLLAASLLASDPVKYGFTEIDYQDPIPYDKVLAPEPVSLDDVAASMNISADVLKDLNPELRRGVTPPNYPNYELKVPVGTQDTFQKLYASIPRYKASDIQIYRVRSGDTLSKIARKYGVSTTTVAEFNRISTKKTLRRGQEILIPVGERNYPVIAKAPSTPKTYELANTTAVVSGEQYIVQNGDTLWKISRKFNVTVSQLRRWNQMKRSAIHPGQKLIISNQKKSEAKPPQSAQTSSTSPTEGWKTYMIQLGDNLWSVARKLNVPARNLAEWNGLNAQAAALKPGDTLKFRL